ncbi:MAG: ABC transporter substrate-binding protein, partial [Verrucomicrobia bacterium]|nr:ABC transporter substrate-binding protein [Verrucomicrobiota bacterium]
MKQRLKYWLPGLSIVALLGCVLFLFMRGAARGDLSKARAAARALRAAQATAPTPIQVAVVWPNLDPTNEFIRGLTFARDEINQKGGILGRLIRLVFYRETPEVARRVAEDVDTVAVIGYEYSSNATLDSVTLNNEGIVFLIPFASDWELTIKDFRYSFRIIPNARHFADLLAQYCLSQAARYAVEPSRLTAVTNRFQAVASSSVEMPSLPSTASNRRAAFNYLRSTSANGGRGATNRRSAAAIRDLAVKANELKVTILSPRNDFGYQLERRFRKDAADWKLVETINGVTNVNTVRVVASRSYPPDTVDFLDLIDKVLSDSFDVVMVTDKVPTASRLIWQLREMGITAPIIGGRGLDSPNLLTEASNRAFRVYFPSKFVIPTPEELAATPTNCLVRAFLRRFNRPSFESAQGYEGLHLLAEAWDRAGTTKPLAVASLFEHMSDWDGLLESY